MVLVLATLGLLLTSFFCSVSEAALLSLSRARAEHLASRGRAGRFIRRIKENPETAIGAILILNTVANTGGAALAGAEFRKLFGDQALAFFGVGLTLAVLVLSEFIPKSIGVRYAERSALILAAPLQVVITLLRPATWLVSQASRLVGLSKQRAAVVSIDDLRAMARLAASANLLGREELMIIEAASRLPRVPVHQLMIHRDDIVYFSLASDADANLLHARRSLHSRMPLCREGLESIVGLVNMKEVLWRLVDMSGEIDNETLNRILGEALRPPLYVDAANDVSDLIELFAKSHEHLAVVRRDKEVVGIVTLEDVVEELMGEIDDEFDLSPSGVESTGKLTWRIGGGALWADVQEQVGIRFGASQPADLDGRIDLNDIVAENLRGRLRTGNTFLLGQWQFRVARMRRGKVTAVDVFHPDADPRAKAEPLTTMPPT